MKTFLLLLLSCFLSFGAYSQVIHVKPDATGNGTSWDEATDLQSALQSAFFGVEIWVAEGIYKPASCTICGEPERNTAFVIKDGVKLLGGFNGTETNSDQRLVTQNLTILSGDINNDNLLTDNSFTVVSTRSVSNQTLIDGFTIQGGNADFENSALGDSHNSGAGFYNNGQLQGFTSQPVLRNCIFTNNFAVGLGGAIYSDGSFGGNASPLFENVKFIDNSAKNSGGAFYGNAIFGGISNPTFSACEFTGNVAIDKDGGAMVNDGGTNGFSNSLIEDCHFEGNTAYLEGGAVLNIGNKGFSNPIFRNTVFIRNQGHLGGAVFSDGFDGETKPQFIDCEFLENRAVSNGVEPAIQLGDGGAVYNLGSAGGFCQSEFVRCNFENNNSTGSGGAVLNNGTSGTCDPIFSNCEFKQNVSEKFGAVMYNIGNSGHCNPIITNCLFEKNTGFSAGAIYNLGADMGQSNPFISNCTFVGNRAEVGGAIYCNANDSLGQSNPVISNCVFYDNYAPTGKVFRIIYGFPTVEYSVFDLTTCEELTDHASSNVNCGDGLIFNREMFFKDTLNGDYSLLEGAPYIDEGNNDSAANPVDLEGNPRIVNGKVDLGAYEFQGTIITPPAIVEQPQSANACENESVTFNIGVSSADSISYQWKKDGNLIPGANQSAYELTSDLQSAGSYTCEVTNSAGTVESAVATLTVEELVPFSIELEAPSTVCEGAEVQVKAAFTNGGDTPKIMWLLNSNLIDGAIDDSITVSGIFGVGTVSCRVISSQSCVDEQTKVESVDISSVPFVTPTIQITGPDTAVCVNETVLIESTITNGGTSPTYDWYLNNNLTTINMDFFQLDSLREGDIIQAVLTSSEECPSDNQVFSNEITLETKSCTSSAIDISDNYDISLFPNPVDNILKIEAQGFTGELILSIFNAQGSEMATKKVKLGVSAGQMLEIKTPNYPSGTYFLNLKNKELSTTRLFIKK